MPEPVDADTQQSLELLARLKAQIQRIILGQAFAIDQLLIALLCGGHALLEGVPGTAKTLTVRTLAMAMSCRTKRISFTPDLMPSDILGTNIFDMATSTFRFHEGPVFTDLLLADEINRAPAKTQSALLEAMAERRVTIDAAQHVLSPVFTVFATQNPVEFEGTYPLPEAQQDRFLLKIIIPYPDAPAERELVAAVHRGEPPDRMIATTVEPVLQVESLLRLQAMVPRVKMEEGVLDYVLKIVRSTRENTSILLGAGPRGSIFLLQAAKAHALVNGRDFATPDDVARMVGPVLAHRLTLSAEAEVGGVTAEDVLKDILNAVEVPR